MTTQPTDITDEEIQALEKTTLGLSAPAILAYYPNAILRLLEAFKAKKELLKKNNDAHEIAFMTLHGCKQEICDLILQIAEKDLMINQYETALEIIATLKFIPSHFDFNSVDDLVMSIHKAEKIARDAFSFNRLDDIEDKNKNDF